MKFLTGADEVKCDTRDVERGTWNVERGRYKFNRFDPAGLTFNASPPTSAPVAINASLQGGNLIVLTYLSQLLLLLCRLCKIIKIFEIN